MKFMPTLKISSLVRRKKTSSALLRTTAQTAMVRMILPLCLSMSPLLSLPASLFSSLTPSLLPALLPSLLPSAAATTLSLGLFVAAAPAHAYDPLDFVPEQVPAARLSGGGELRHYGKPVYAAKLFIDPGSFSPEDVGRESFALDLEYKQPYAGAEIARDLSSQMKDMGSARSAKIDDWRARLGRLLPNVKVGDHLTAVFWPGRGTGFFRNGELMGEIHGNAFAQAFFGIWLGETTAMPGLRAQLLRGSN